MVLGSRKSTSFVDFFPTNNHIVYLFYHKKLNSKTTDKQVKERMTFCLLALSSTLLKTEQNKTRHGYCLYVYTRSVLRSYDDDQWPSYNSVVICLQIAPHPLNLHGLDIKFISKYNQLQCELKFSYFLQRQLELSWPS